MAGSVRLTNVVLMADEVDQARARLVRLVEEASADAAVLVLRSGEVAVWHAEHKLDKLETLGALLAANFASAREIARLLGESGFESQFQQGASRQVMTHAVGEGWLLSTLFAQQSQLGLVRMLTQRAAEDLRPVYEAARIRAATEQARPAPPGFRVAATNAIDALFKERG